MTSVVSPTAALTPPVSLTPIKPAADQAAAADFGAALQSAETATADKSAAARSSKAYQQFEAFVLQTFIEAMLPKDSTNVFGQGIAGETWKSMMAEKIASEVAGTGLLDGVKTTAIARASAERVGEPGE